MRQTIRIPGLGIVCIAAAKSCRMGVCLDSRYSRMLLLLLLLLLLLPSSVVVDQLGGVYDEAGHGKHLGLDDGILHKTAGEVVVPFTGQPSRSTSMVGRERS